MAYSGWGLLNILKSARALYVAREEGAQQGRGKRDIERARLKHFLLFLLCTLDLSKFLSFVLNFSQCLRQLSHSLKKANISGNCSVVFILVLNIKTVFKTVNVAFKIVSSFALVLRASTYDQTFAAINSLMPDGVNLIQMSEGSVSLKVQVVNLSALEHLWRLYKDGTLQASLQALFVTDEMRELAGGEQVEAIVTIEPQEYEKARNELAAFEAQGKGWIYLTLNEP